MSIFGTNRTIANGGGPGREPRPVRTPWNTFCGLLRELFFIKISTHQILYFRFPGSSSGLYTSPEKEIAQFGVRSVKIYTFRTNFGLRCIPGRRTLSKRNDHSTPMTPS